MLLNDAITTAYWWFILFAIGFSFFPFTRTIFSQFFDKGYVFSKIIGITIISYIVFFVGIFHVLAFTRETAIGITIFCCVLSFLSTAFFKKRPAPIKKTLLETKSPNFKIAIIEELLFIIALFFWAYIRGVQPDIHGLEKYMDFGFINSILRSTYFPPKDMWFPPNVINYYYFGHIVTAVLTKISGIPSAITFNLMLATIFAFTFTCSFSLSYNFILHAQEKIKGIFQWVGAIIASFLSASLVTLAGNLHILYAFFTPYANDTPLPLTKLAFSPQAFPNSYWYPNATRFIYNTIHEFPIYSFVVSDLHGHVLDIPIVLTIVALLYHTYLAEKIQIKTILLISLLLAVAYMTNAWDGFIYYLLTVGVIFLMLIKRNTKKLVKGIHFPSFSLDIINFFFYCMVIFAGLFIFASPFSFFFQTASIVHGIGVLCAPGFLTKFGHVGPFLFELDHCQKSPLWQLITLYGFFYFWIISFIIFLIKFKKISKTTLFLLLLVTVSTALILIPEFVYVKDIYPAHYRANTMFKLVYQAFMMLSLVSGFAIYFITCKLKTVPFRIIFSPFLFLGFMLVILVFIYPYFAITSYYGAHNRYKGLDGTKYLESLYPDDYAAIQWVNRNIPGQPVMLEAQGDSYTDYGRISIDTGLPTVLGWTVHEWLWRGSYDIPAPRISEVQTIYETVDQSTRKTLLDKYHISYIYVGQLEKEKYPKLNQSALQHIGKIIYQKEGVTIYKING